eukprot:scaffold138805_cov22-Cyclotella_meneghiniana.AAC.1
MMRMRRFNATRHEENEEGCLRMLDVVSDVVCDVVFTLWQWWCSVGLLYLMIINYYASLDNQIVVKKIIDRTSTSSFSWSTSTKRGGKVCCGSV